MENLNDLRCSVTVCETRTPDLSGFEIAILFIKAGWSGQSNEQFARKTEALRELDSAVKDVTLFIEDSDNIDYDHIVQIFKGKCCGSTHTSISPLGAEE